MMMMTNCRTSWVAYICRRFLIGCSHISIHYLGYHSRGSLACHQCRCGGRINIPTYSWLLIIIDQPFQKQTFFGFLKLICLCQWTILMKLVRSECFLFERVLLSQGLLTCFLFVRLVSLFKNCFHFYLVCRVVTAIDRVRVKLLLNSSLIIVSTSCPNLTFVLL